MTFLPSFFALASPTAPRGPPHCHPAATTGMRSVCTIMLLAAATDALLVTPAKQPAVKPAIKRPALTVTAAVLPLCTSLPALAVGDASDLEGLNGILTGAIGLLLIVPAIFFASAAKEVGDQAEERMDRLGMNNKRRAPGRSIGTVYDDTDYSYKSNQKAVVNSRDRKKTSKQFGKDGKRLAPWMVIDEKRIEKAKAARKENKRKTGKFFG